jgi:hypothetical protein
MLSEGKLMDRKINENAFQQKARLDMKVATGGEKIDE